MRDNDPQDHTAYRSHKQALEQYGFLLQWFVSQAEKVAAGQAAEGAITAAGKRVSLLHQFELMAERGLLPENRGAQVWVRTEADIGVASAETDEGGRGQERKEGGVYLDNFDPGNAQRNGQGTQDQD